VKNIDSFLIKYGELTEQMISVKFEKSDQIPSESLQYSGETIRISDLSGVRNAINLINQSARNGKELSEGLHSPSFAIRGVIEGFYGTPWSHDQRKRGLIHFAKKNMNSFVFAPKDDPWQRFDWRTPFQESFLKTTEELVQLGRDVLVDVSVCVSPGLTISYSSKEDLSALLVRYKQLHNIGVRRFGLLLDDIPGDLQYPEDKKNFATMAEAHAQLSNNVLSEISKFGEGISLFVCPLQYHGRGHEPYISELGRKLNSTIDVMWTGRQICSEYLEVIDAKNFLSHTTKRPFYWDNFPVNDVAMVHQLHIGPIQKREADLGSHAVGLVANPMDRFEASLIPLTTIADYLWNSSLYQHEQSWEIALKEFVVVERDRKALRHLFRNCFESCLAVDAAPDFGGMLGSVTLAWRTGKLSEASQTLKEWSSRIEENYSVITSSDFSWTELRKEIGPWLNKYRNVGHALLEVSKIILSAQFLGGRLQGTDELSNAVRKIRNSLAEDPTRIFGDGLDLVLGELATELSVAKS
jgi:hyaluronoglucosaminidase